MSHDAFIEMAPLQLHGTEALALLCDGMKNKTPLNAAKMRIMRTWPQFLKQNWKFQ